MKKVFSAISPDVEEHHLFLASGEKNYTYEDLFSFGTFFIERLEKYEISANRPLSLHTESSDTLVFIIAACWLHNIPFVPFNPKANSDTLAKRINKIQPGLLITDSPDENLSHHLPTISIDQFNPLKKVVRENSLSLLPDLNQHEYPDKETFGYFFTSGTSDEPKIVPLKRRQLHVAAKASAANLRLTTNEAWLLCMPLYHIGGISVILRSLLYGSAIYRMDRFDEDAASKLLSKNQQIVAASFVPTMLKRLLDNASFTTHKVFKGILLGGGPIDTRLLKTCITRNIPVIPSYGMTETCAQIAANPVNGDPHNPELLNSAGKIFSPNKIEIRDENNKLLPTEKSGTIWLKGAQIFDGYHNVSTRNSFDNDGWFNTGDFGRLDVNENVYIEARRTDLIITGGENVSPYEVESVLKGFEFVKDAAVFGISDKEWGQKVVAAVVLENIKEKPIKTIQNMLREKLESFKIPKKILAVEKLPQTETGKIKRSELEGLFK